MLVRRHVAKLLADYYAQPANRVVGSVSLSEGNINFKRLWGEWHYRRLCARLYAKQEGRWLTSVELMRPYYSKALGNFVAAQAKVQLQESKGHDTFDIVEIGGGRATNATIILSQLQGKYPDIYAKINSYTMIDASRSLLELQEQTMRSGDHLDKMRFELKDMIDVAENRWVKRFCLSPYSIEQSGSRCDLTNLRMYPP
jgi:SAM-dependent MidA family methyltransferase